MDVYDRFPLQSFQLLDGSTQGLIVFCVARWDTQLIKSSVIKK